MHPVPLLTVSLLSLAVLLFQFSVELGLLLLVLNSLYSFKAGLSVNKIFKVIITLPLLASSIFVLNILYPAGSVALEVVMERWMRLSVLSMISVLAAWSIDFHTLLYYLMSTNKLRASIGYPILAAINAVRLVKRENKKITTVIKLRALRPRRVLTRYFLLLVFAIRHSQRVAIALVSRGLNDHKTYINQYSIPLKDWRAIIPFLLLLSVLEIVKLLPQALS